MRLQKKLRGQNPLALQKELQKQINERIIACTEAIPMFCKELEKSKNWSTQNPVIWAEGSTELYEYISTAPKQQSSPILIIPSLINRHYILDLEEDNSFVNYIADNGFNSYLASWGEPLEEELNFSLDQYISRIEKMIDLLYRKTGKKVILTGYCMGGILGLAAAQRNISKIKSLAFLATPWNFHEKNFSRFTLDKTNLKIVENIIDSCERIPAFLVQALFYYIHSNLVGQKFEMGPLINNKNHSKSGFLAIEKWANDGISMSRAVAKECFLGWVHNNNVAKHKWKINGQAVLPGRLADLPAFFIIPKKDSVVPPGSTKPLTKYFKNLTIIEPNVGHVGMVVGNLAKSQSWEPFVKWLGVCSNTILHK